MKAMVLTAPGELVQDEVARPAPAPSDVLVRVTHSGICGTDYKIFNGSIPGPLSAHHGPRDGRRGRRGGQRRRFAPATCVIVDPELYCGACFHCRIGQTHLCPNGLLLGRDANGGFAEYLAAPATPRVQAARRHRSPRGADDSGAHDLSARAAADRHLPWRIRRRARARRDRTAARTAREGTRRDGDWRDAQRRQARAGRDARRRYDGSR